VTATVRRGLPRVPGGEPWPPVRRAEATVVEPSAGQAGSPPAAEPSESSARGAPPGGGARVVSAAGGVALRRGLPRVPGGEPWPPAGVAPGAAPAPSVTAPAPAPAAAEAPAAARPRRTWLRAVAALGGGAALAAVALVVGVRWLMGLEPVSDFVARYPGTYPLPEGAPVGIPAWLAWQHFFNAFLLVLIVRTGLAVRVQARPPAYWAPRGGGARVGLTAWTHQALDVFWVANGAVYIALLLVTGQWMRIVPTSWDAAPHALSVALQYASLDWPAEDGWVHYNALQQLTYFVTVFVAAPLAIATGVRMSMWWREGGRWERAYPKAWARAVHFPVMLYFVAFVVGHVGLVLATGARRNLNHMFAARDDAGWLGVVVLLVAVAVTAAAALALRPLLVAPVAGRFGTVTER